VNHGIKAASQLRGYNQQELDVLVLRGLVAYDRGVYVPIVGGGDPTVDAVLGKISKQLDDLDKREAGGEDVKEARAKLVADAIADHAKVDDDVTPVNETAEQKLARLEREQRMSKQAEALAVEIAARVRTDQDAEASALAKMVQERVQGLLGGDSVEDVVKRALAQHRPGSRFATDGADDDFVKHIAAGGSAATFEAKSPISMGSDREFDSELKTLVDSKSLAVFMRTITRVKAGRATPAERLFVESGGTGQKALAEGTPSSGGYLVRPEWMPDVLGLLRGAAVVRQAGPRVVNFGRLMNQTSISTGATAYYTAENAAIAKSEQTFAEAPLLTPHNLTALVPVSNYLLNDPNVAGGGVDEIVRNDMIVVMALREDLAFLRGTGASGEPTGFRNMAGITLNPLGAPATNGFQPTLPQLRRMLAVFRTQNAVNLAPVWFFNPAFLSYLEGLTDTLGRFLVDTNLLTYGDNAALGASNPGGLMTGRFLGAPFFATNQLPANLTQGSSSNATDLFLVNISEAIIGINQELELDLSAEASYTPDGGTTWINAFQNNQTLFRTVIRHDIAHRRPAQVLVQTGVLV
jgi:HK97 family phage major capsid protein